MNFFSDSKIQYPSLKGQWVPIFLEPIMGSGERIAVAILYCIGSDEIRIRQVIRQEVIDGIYGCVSENFNGIVSATIDYLAVKISNISMVVELKLPFGGVSFGVIQDCYATDEMDLLTQAVSLTASLGTISFESESEQVIDDGKGNERFATAVHNEAVSINPGIIQNFNRRLSVGNGKILTRYGFVNRKIAVNFGTLSPAYIPQSANNVKAKILDLEALKIHCEEETPELIEMIVWRPDVSDPLISKKTMMKINDTIFHLQDLARTIDLGFSEVFSIRQTAEYLTSKAA